MFFVALEASDTNIVVGASLTWAVNSTMLDATSGGSPCTDGEPVARWLADDGNTVLDQATAAQRPLCDLDSMPGRSAATFTGDDSLSGAVTGHQGAILVITGPQGSLAHVILSRDTSQAATTAPAFTIASEEY